MGKKSKITHQALNNLQKQTKYGQSKHLAKEKAREEARKTGEKVKEVRGIYSTRTYTSYAKVCKQFIQETIKAHPSVRTFDDCRPYVEEFLESKSEKDVSAWTLHQYGSALACAYGCSKNDFAFIYPERSRADIIRCRNEHSSDYRYPEERWDKAKMLIKATGCRRMEALRLRKKDFRERKDGNLEVFKRGKNNIERWCLVNPKYTNEVKDFLREAPTHRINDEERLLLKAEIPRGSIHDLRADYARDLYKYFESHGGVATGEKYYCRKELAGKEYDKGILHEVSYNLQHSRNNVVISYLWKS